MEKNGEHCFLRCSDCANEDRNDGYNEDWTADTRTHVAVTKMCMLLDVPVHC